MESALYEELARAEEGHWWVRGRAAILEALVERWVEARFPGRVGQLRLLDLGCGTGFLSQRLQRFGTVEGLETAPEARTLARARLGSAFVLHEAPLPGGLPVGAAYDVVTAFDVLEHLRDAPAALSAVRAALRPGGLLVCTVPAFPFLWSAHDEAHHHVRRYRDPVLRAQLQQGGLDVRWSSYFNAGLFPAISAVRLAQRGLRWTAPARSAGSDLGRPPPAPLNAVLERLFASGRHLLVRGKTLPFGVSLAAVAVRPEAA